MTHASFPGRTACDNTSSPGDHLCGGTNQLVTGHLTKKDKIFGPNGVRFRGIPLKCPLYLPNVLPAEVKYLATIQVQGSFTNVLYDTLERMIKSSLNSAAEITTPKRKAAQKELN